MERVSSRHNPAVAACRALARERSQDQMLLDGFHLVQEALDAGVRLDMVAFAERVLSTSPLPLVDRIERAGVRVLSVTDQVMRAMSPVSTPGGVVAVARVPAPPPDLARLGVGPVIVAVDIQDPGNLGSIVRVAEAGCAAALVAAGTCADPFGWKALRGAMGSAFRFPIYVERNPETALARVRATGRRIWLTDPREGVPYQEADLRGPAAFVLGGEGAGVPRGLRGEADGVLSIPMRRPVDSLNVGVAAALFVYEAVRQAIRNPRTASRNA
jgi:TrmH family RNA methyltransferase